MKIRTTWHHWVRLACSQYIYKESLLRPWIENGWIIATDGFRAHMVKTDRRDGILDSEYEYCNLTDVKTPDVLGILPAISLKKWMKYKAFMPESYKLKNDKSTMMMKGMEFQSKYIVDAFGGAKTMEVAQCKQGTDFLYMRSLDRRRRAVIMRLRGEEEEEEHKTNESGWEKYETTDPTLGTRSNSGFLLQRIKDQGGQNN